MIKSALQSMDLWLIVKTADTKSNPLKVPGLCYNANPSKIKILKTGYFMVH